MTATTTGVAEAGWYDDPADTTRERYWNGIVWTTHTRLARLTGLALGTPLVAQEDNDAAVTSRALSVLGAICAIVALVAVAIVVPHQADGVLRYLGWPIGFVGLMAPIVSIAAVVVGIVGLSRSRSCGGLSVAVTGIALGAVQIGAGVFALGTAHPGIPVLIAFITGS